MSTINVNLRSCDCDGHVISGGGDSHLPDCASRPIPTLCPIPRSVAFEVRLGECDCAPGHVGHFGRHSDACPARPIRVSCSISGKTWPSSEVFDVDSEQVVLINDEPFHRESLAACRDRWALVRTLVTGGPHGVDERLLAPASLVKQRDAVYAAITDQARLEEKMLQAQQRTVAAIASPRLTTGEVAPENRPSAQALAEYVERLIEQVGVL